MNEQARNTDDLIVKYLLGEASDEEKAELITWIKADTSNESYFFHYKEIWEISQIKNTPEIQTDKSWNELREKMNEKTKPEKQIRRFWPMALKYAASVLVIIGIGFSIYKFGGMLLKKEKTYTEIKTLNGQKKQIILTDGTEIWLNSGTTLRYANDYGEKKREVYLIGEAFFNVTKDINRMFEVRTDKVTVKVLGTSFNINCYPELETIETTVITGIVRVENNEKTKDRKVVILNKQEKGTYNRTLQEMTISGNDKSEALKKDMQSIPLHKISLSQEEADYMTLWKDQVLYFNNESFEEIALKLQRWFNIKIIFKDPHLKNYRYKGKFNDAKSITQILEVIKLTTPIAYEYNEKTKEITITELKKK